MADSTFDRNAEMAELRKSHTMGHETVADAAWDMNPICTADGTTNSPDTRKNS